MNSNKEFYIYEDDITEGRWLDVIYSINYSKTSNKTYGLTVNCKNINEVYSEEELDNVDQKKYSIMYSDDVRDWEDFCDKFGLDSNSSGIYFEVIDVEVEDFEEEKIERDYYLEEMDHRLDIKRGK